MSGVPICEREELQIVRDLSSIWESPQLHEHKAVLSGGAARPLLHYCARKILEIRRVHGVSGEEFPLIGGRVHDVLLSELVSGQLDDINQFVKNIVSAALQTADAKFFIPNLTAVQVDSVVDADPPVFSSERALSIARTLSDKIDQLLEDMLPLNHTLNEYSNLDVICRKLRNVEFRCYETMQQRQQELKLKAGLSAMPTATTSPTGAGASRGATPKQVNRHEVDKVRSHLLETVNPINDLRRSLAMLSPTESLTKRRKLIKNMRKRGRDFHGDLVNLLFSLDDLKIFDETDRVFRRDTVEKVQDMLDELDSISYQIDQTVIAGKPEQPATAKQPEMPVRSAAVAGMGAGAAAGAVSGAGAGAATSIPATSLAPTVMPTAETIPAATPAATPGPTPMATPEAAPTPVRRVQMEEAQKVAAPQQEMPADVRKMDWRQLKLPIRFDSRVTPQAYLLLASIGNLDLASLKLTVAAQQDSLRVEGFKTPTETEKTQLEQTGDVFKALANAQGRFGTFKEEFQLPKDVQSSEIYAEYNRGILRVVVPRNLASRPAESFFGVPGDFFEGEVWW